MKSAFHVINDVTYMFPSNNSKVIPFINMSLLVKFLDKLDTKIITYYENIDIEDLCIEIGMQSWTSTTKVGYWVQEDLNIIFKLF